MHGNSFFAQNRGNKSLKHYCIWYFHNMNGAENLSLEPTFNVKPTFLSEFLPPTAPSRQKCIKIGFSQKMEEIQTQNITIFSISSKKMVLKTCPSSQFSKLRPLSLRIFHLKPL